MRATLALLVAALLLPTASAGWFTRDEPLTVTVGASRVGDLLQYEEDALDVQWEPREGQQPEMRQREVTWTYVVQVEGFARVTDKYGLEREAVAHRVDRREGDSLVASERCYALPGGNVSVRRDRLYGDGEASGWGYGSTGLGPVDIQKQETRSFQQQLASYYAAPCHGQNAWAGRVLREGDTLTFADALSIEDPRVPDVVSAPAVRAEFHGRPALAFVLDLAPVAPGYVLTVTFADGLPGIVRSVSQSPDTERPYRIELTGYAAGQGAELPAPSGARLPATNPTAPTRTVDRLSFDTSAYGLDYPYEDAYAALLADPTTGVKAFLDAHPGAYLMHASYSGFDETDATGTRTTGGDWVVWFEDKDAGFYATTALRVSHVGPLSIPRPASINRGMATEGAPFDALPTLPKESAGSATFAALAKSNGVDRVRSVSYFVFATPEWTDGYLLLSTSAQADGSAGRAVEQEAAFDAFAGGLQETRTTETLTRTSGLLAPPGGTLGEPRVSTLGALAGPGVGVGLGVGAATGLALLVVAIKFLLVPLFTRLVRARLLDNPVRARLYERVRAEPGIRQAELVDFLGVGEGTTRHHLAQLVKHRYVVEARDGAVPTYYAAGEVPPDVARRAAVLRSASAKRVYDLYAAEPGLSLREAAARLDMRAPSVHRQRRKLQDAGLLPAATPAPVASASP